MPIALNSQIYDANDYFTTQLLLNKRLGNGRSTYCSTVRLGDCKEEDVFNYILNNLLPDSVHLQEVVEMGEDSHLVTEGCWVTVSRRGEMVTVQVRGDKEEVERVQSSVRGNFPSSPPYIRWMIKPDGESIKLPVDSSSLPSTSFYPQLAPLSPSLSSYYDQFLSSRSNILVLFGPAGTGKTSFIRGLLHHANKNALISYDPAVLERDSVFASFLSGREDIMILEDADGFLGSRSKGNTVMHRFLNVGDGLISTGKKKIIFSTNLPTIKDVDSALLRPGRCFDVLKFRALTAPEARAIKPEYEGEADVTLAELFNGGKGKDQVKGAGFL